MAHKNVEVVSTGRLLFAEPQLFVSGLQRSCEFYTMKLGFAVAFTTGEPAFYAQVVWDGARFNLRQLDEPVWRPEVQSREHLLSATITVEDADAIFREFQAAGAAFHQPLRTEPWGAWPFLVSDPDGNLLLFAGNG